MISRASITALSAFLVGVLLISGCDEAPVPDAGAGDAGDAGPPMNSPDGGPLEGCWAERSASDFPDHLPWSEHLRERHPDGDVAGEIIVVDRPVIIEGPEMIEVRGIHVTGEGRLVVGAVDVTLRTTYVLVENGGEMTIGQEGCHYENAFHLELYGGRDAPEVLGDAELGFGEGQTDLSFGNKVLAVGNGGTLDLHGARGNPSWTRLGGNVAEGATRFVVEGGVDWLPGDRLVVTSSDFEPEHSEVRTIAADGVQSSGGMTEITVTEPFDFEHWGTIEAESGTDIRASVGLLTRNIRITSDMTGAPTGYGGQTQYRRGSTVRLEGVELYQLGQAGEVGRYPMHFHLMVDAAGSYARRCAVHDSFQRWYVLHGVRNLVLEDNVGYRAMGHGYFLEDGTETQNTLRHNLGALVIGVAQDDEYWNPDGQPPLTYAEQCNPTVFWIANAYNRVVDNVAAGCTFAGRAFWLLATITEGSNPNDHRAGMSTMIPDVTSQPFTNGRYAPILEFRGNTASGCFTGLDTITPAGRLNECAPLFANAHVSFGETPIDPLELDAAGVYDNYQPRHDGTAAGRDVTSVIEGFTAFRNRSWGAWLRDKWYWVHGSHFADNSDSGVTLVSAGDESGIVPGYWSVMTDAHITGFSANRYLDRGADEDFTGAGGVNATTGTFFTGGRHHAKERRGLNFYDGPAAVHDTHFYNFGRYSQLYPDDHTPDIPSSRGAEEYLPHTAIGWFGPGNNFQFSALQETGGLTFNERVFIRHWVYPVDYPIAPPIPLRDGDKQTFILDTDGTLQGAAMSGSINDYRLHRGPVWQTECHSEGSCIVSPYRYGNLQMLLRPPPDRWVSPAGGVPAVPVGPELCFAKEHTESVAGSPSGTEPFCMGGFDSAIRRNDPGDTSTWSGFYQYGVLAMLDATYTAQFYERGTDHAGAQVAPPDEMHLRLANVDDGAESRVSMCYPSAVQAADFEVWVSGQEINVNHALEPTWDDETVTTDVGGVATQVTLVEGTDVEVTVPGHGAAPSPGVVTLRLEAGNLQVRLRQTEARDDTCYPLGFCTEDPAAPGECTLADGVSEYTDMCEGADCAAICRRFGNHFSICPESGCLTVRIRCTGANCSTGALSPACADESAWPTDVYGPSICGATLDTGHGGPTCDYACGAGGLDAACDPLVCGG